MSSKYCKNCDILVKCKVVYIWWKPPKEESSEKWSKKKNVSEIHLFTFVIQTVELEIDINRKKKVVWIRIDAVGYNSGRNLYRQH